MGNGIFKIQMNQDGAILKSLRSVRPSFLVIPDYIKLEKASYPRMTVNPIEPWTEEDSPPEDYGKNIIDDTFEEDLYYTFYCDSIEWDGRDETINRSGNGSKENPWKNLFFAIEILYEYKQITCCKKMRLIVRGTVTDKYIPTSDVYFFDYNLLIDMTDATIISEENANTVTDKRSLSRFVAEIKFYGGVWKIGNKSNVYTSYSSNITFESFCTDNIKQYLGLGNCCNINIKGKNLNISLQGVCKNIGVTDGILACSEITCVSCEFSNCSIFAYKSLMVYSTLDGVFRIHDAVEPTPRYCYNCHISAEAIYPVHLYGFYYNTDITVNRIKAHHPVDGIGISNAYILNCNFLVEFVHIYTEPTQRYEANAVTARNAYIKNTKIQAIGELPNIIDPSEECAGICPLRVYEDVTVLNCELIGYKAIGKVPEGACGL